jgi:hypothetical protein
MQRKNGMTQRTLLVVIGAAIVFVGACQSQQTTAGIDSPASQSQSANCSKPVLFPGANLAKYPSDAKPGFNSPEEVTALLEKRWPLTDIRKFAIPERRHNDEWQNLVPLPDTTETWAGRLYCDKTTWFDSIEWYATVRNGSVQEFSLDAMRGKDFWLLEIGSPASVQKLPDFEPNFRAPQFVGNK